MKKTIGAFGLFLFWLLLLSQANIVLCQQDANTQVPVFTCDERDHDFGRIRETAGYAVHEFIFKNTGTAPLKISRVLTNCGCAQPEWSQKEIEPGEEGFVIISYDMVDRPGPFSKNITVYTNERTLRQALTIKGDVIPKPETLHVLFKDTIGTVQMEQSAFDFYSVRPRESNPIEIWIQHFGKEDLSLVVEDVPDFLNVTVPTYLESDFPDRMVVEIDTSKVNENYRGRLVSQFRWTTESATGEKTTHIIPVSVNFVDDFRGMSSALRSEGPDLQISIDVLDFGKLKKKRVYKEISLTNKGKSALNLHSISIDNSKFTEITGFNKQVLQPEETLKLRVFVNPKDIKDTLSTDLFIISNDTRRPVQAVHIAAVK